MRPWRDSQHPLKDLLIAARDGEPEDDELAAAVRVRARLQSTLRPLRRSTPWFFVTCGALAALALAVVWFRHEPAVTPLDTGGAVAGLRWQWVPKQTGAKFAADRTITLGEGLISLEVSKPVRVVTPQAELKATHARFRLLVAAGGAANVIVEEGEVVVRERGQDTHITAGAQWSSPETAGADASLHRWALELEGQGQQVEALAVLEALATHHNTWGELALYDAARLSLRLHERSRAEGLLATYAERYGATGVLVREVQSLRGEMNH